MSVETRLPDSFLRGLEADLRALCTDARRKNPHVKDTAERVILALKEADTPELKILAADSAAAAFCAACESPPSTNSAAISSYVKVVLRAVSSLHKLLTHRAVSSRRLPEVLDALHRLAVSCLDDTITLKVLQGLLSLLTVRSYSKALSEDDLSRAFSLLFVLKTSRAAGSGNPASNALSAISNISSGGGGIGSGGSGAGGAVPELGVIEQTSKAAFRQASSDLFASAADAAVQTAVRMQVPSGEVIPLEDFPTEARASYRFFMDLCHSVSGQPLAWLSRLRQNQQQPLSLDLALALEVIDDGLSSSVGLFAAQPVFLDVVSKTLCPVIHRLLTTKLDRITAKALFALIVTVVIHYWRNLPVESQELLHALVRICIANVKQGTATDTTTWPTVFSMEAIRCIFRSQLVEASVVIDFVREFELSEWSTNPISAIIGVACNAMALPSSNKGFELPPSPITGALKPFAKTISNSFSFLASASTGVYVHIIMAAQMAAEKEEYDVAKVLLNNGATGKAVAIMGKFIELHPFSMTPVTPRLGDANIPDPVDALAHALSSATVVAFSCDMGDIQVQAFSTLSSVCAATIRNSEGGSPSDYAKRVSILYKVLFDVVSTCQETLGRSWSPAVEAFEVLDSLIYKVEQSRDSNSPIMSTAESLKSRLNAVFSATEKLKWSACHDMISALVKCSRQSMASIPKRSSVDDLSTKSEKANTNLRVFGISAAEAAMLNAFRRTSDAEDAMPSTLWELLAGHLASVCADSPVYSLRTFALNSLTRIACDAIPTTETTIVAHEKIITPFLDLFNSSHSDVRSGSLSSLYTILETQGERLRGEAAWRVVLSILTTAAGSKAFAKAKDGGPTSGMKSSTVSVGGSVAAAVVVTQGDEMISEGFKVVQVIADDFLSSLARNSLPAWLEVLGLYCRQEDDINVALTSIGLLWRTADFLAKERDVTSTEDLLWVEVFHILKEISMDERPEIRNCAVKTLTGALTAHSTRLSARAWSGCTEQALLPLLEEVMKGGAAIPSQGGSGGGSAGGGNTIVISSMGDESAVGRSGNGSGVSGSGTAGGRNDAQVMWHHSRDTPRKQWNETRVLALGGVAKVLRSAMPRLAILHDESGRPLFLTLTDGGANGLWRKMLRAAGVAAASRDGEVAVAGVSALLEMLGAAGFVVGGQDDDNEDESKEAQNAVLEKRNGDSQELGSSSSAPASLGTGTAGSAAGSVVASMSWVAGVITGTATSTDATSQMEQNMAAGDEASTESATLHSAIKDATVSHRSIKGTVLLWEAVWSALVEAICGPDAAAGMEDENGKKVGSESFNCGGGSAAVSEASRIVDEKALQMLAEGLIESHAKLADKFTPRSSRMLLQVLMYLAAGSIGRVESEQAKKQHRSHQYHHSYQTSGQSVTSEHNASLTQVQEVTLRGLRALSFGNDVESWEGFLHGLLRLIPARRRYDLAFGVHIHAQNVHPRRHAGEVLLTRRALEILRASYISSQMPDVVKVAQLHLVIPVLGRIMLARRDLERIRLAEGGVVMRSGNATFSSSASIRNKIVNDGPSGHASNSGVSSISNVGDADNDVESDEADEWTLWKVGCDVLIIAMRHACDSQNDIGNVVPKRSSSSLTAEWSVCADVMEDFLFGDVKGHVMGFTSITRGTSTSTTANAMSFTSAAERTQREVYDMKLAACLADGVHRMRCGNVKAQQACRKLVHVLARGASEGEALGRRRFVRMCQGRLFSLGASSGRNVIEHKNNDDDVVQEECGRQLVYTCDSVLATYIADGARAGRCPLPAGRRAEAVFLLRHLRHLISSDDQHQQNGHARKRVLALYPRLCQCVESGDEAIRLLAKELLDETSLKVKQDETTSGIIPA